MKLTYNNGETTVTVEGTFVEVIDWYKTFVHSQTACESSYENKIVGLDKDGKIDLSMLPPTVFVETNNPVNDPRAGEPDEDGWMTWTATDSDDIPNGLREKDKVDFIASRSDGTSVFADDLTWCDITNVIVKFRLAK